MCMTVLGDNAMTDLSPPLPRESDLTILQSCHLVFLIWLVRLLSGRNYF